MVCYLNNGPYTGQLNKWWSEQQAILLTENVRFSDPLIYILSFNLKEQLMLL